ncbi:methyl-accepting chemotaxis protein [Cohnella cellulosilytica]|uniref:Methyl-accepting chemotaxis protein n=1 Tax=Cohnella cellulosilytica TaxID=986710 RepID=A0ABW2FI21_9BACL
MDTFHENSHDPVTNELVFKALEQNLAIIRFDLNRRVTYVNDIFAATLGYPKEQMIGMHHQELCFDEFIRSRDYEEFWSNLFNGNSYQDKIDRKNANGEHVWLEATYMPVYDEQSEQILGVSKIATDITNRQNNITAVVKELRMMSTDLNDRTARGTEQSKQLSSGISSIAAVSEQNREILVQLQEQAKAIQGIVQTIRDIASQTQLLSLNAAIEAAHAGDFGRSFDVVAKEVRKLSDNVAQSSIEIRDSVNGITQEITYMTQGMLKVQSQVEDSQKQIQTALAEFDGISDAASQLDAKAEYVTHIV